MRAVHIESIFSFVPQVVTRRHIHACYLLKMFKLNLYDNGNNMLFMKFNVSM